MSAWTSIGEVATIPADNANPVFVTGTAFVPANGDDGATLEVQGQATGDDFYILRRMQISPTLFRWVPFAPDKALSGTSGAAGYFWDRLAIGEHGSGEQFAIFNPGGATITAPMARLVRF